MNHNDEGYDINSLQENFEVEDLSKVFYISDDEWKGLISNYRKQITSIRIPMDITPRNAKQVLSRLNEAYDKIRPLYGDIKSDLNEIENIIDRITTKNTTNGSNREERKANAIIAAENYYIARDKPAINLYDISIQLMHQEGDLKSLLDMIDKKQSSVITFSGLLKIEGNIAGH